MVSQTDYRTMLAEQMLESPTRSVPYGQTLLGHTHSRIVAVGGRGVLAYHTHNSRFSRDGYPDWVIHVPGGAILVAELKRECSCRPGRKQCTYHPTAAQQEWLDDCATRPGIVLMGAAYSDAPGVIRPSHVLAGHFERELRHHFRSAPGCASPPRRGSGAPAVEIHRTHSWEPRRANGWHAG